MHEIEEMPLAIHTTLRADLIFFHLMLVYYQNSWGISEPNSKRLSIYKIQ